MAQRISHASLRFDNRADAGRQLATLLSEYADRDDVLVFGLPRGGVPVAAEVAAALHAPLDVMVVRKLGAPGQPELAMGAIASGGAYVVNPEVVAQVSHEQLDDVIKHEREELVRREREYRGDRAFPDVAGRTVIVIDDGFATGATMRAAVQAMRQYNPREVIVAVPVAPPHVQDSTLREADRFIALLQPTPFYAVGQWYRRFDQTEDIEVTTLLKKSQTSARNLAP